MKKNIIVGLAIAAAVSAVIAWLFYMPIYKAQSLVRDSLIDPESARFSQVTHVRKTGAVCGLVNAKNKMGGYVGDKLFFVTSEGEVKIRPTMTKEKPELKTPAYSGGDPLAAVSRLNRAIVEYDDASGAYKAELNEQLAWLMEAKKNCKPE